MKWEISFYDQKVMRIVLAWPSGIKAKFTHIAELLKVHGPSEVGMPFVKAMGSGLFEILARGQEGIGRAFFCMAAERKIIILHGFIKKSQQTPNKELVVAKWRMKEVK